MASRQETPPRNSTLFVNGKSTCAPILEASYSLVSQADAQMLPFAAEPAQGSDATSQAYPQMTCREARRFFSSGGSARG